jgi:hypothetical protein
MAWTSDLYQLISWSCFGNASKKKKLEYLDYAWWGKTPEADKTDSRAIERIRGATKNFVGMRERTRGMLTQLRDF